MYCLCPLQEINLCKILDRPLSILHENKVREERSIFRFAILLELNNKISHSNSSPDLYYIVIFFSEGGDLVYFIRLSESLTLP